MTHDDIIQYERDIISYNKKGWGGSQGAILLHRAEELIKHYKGEIKHLKDLQEVSDKRIEELEAEDEELKRKICSFHEAMQFYSSEELIERVDQYVEKELRLAKTQNNA